jgi:SAM-dependent MidA family methyltransferase
LPVVATAGREHRQGNAVSDAPTGSRKRTTSGAPSAVLGWSTMNPIVAEVVRQGRMTLAEFMALALYHPAHGFYTRPRAGAGPVGPDGSFLTAPTASPLFARIIAGLLERLAGAVGEPLTVAELGAGEGFLLRGLDRELGERRERMVVRAVAVETAAWARERLLESCPWVEVTARLASCARPVGPTVLFASEFYDALPVHRVTFRRLGETLSLGEFYVESDGGDGLRWFLDRPSSEELEGYLAEHGIVLQEGQVAEVRPAAQAIHAEHLAWCGRNALAVVVDYGYGARQLYNPRGRRGGSLVGYRKHRLVGDVLANPGEVDITAHVNFDDLELAAADLGWERGGIQPLGRFLALHGALELLPAGLGRETRPEPGQWAELAAARRLLSPAGMGTDLKVLVQGRGEAWHAYAGLATPPPAEA